MTYVLEDDRDNVDGKGHRKDMEVMDAGNGLKDKGKVSLDIVPLENL